MSMIATSLILLLVLLGITIPVAAALGVLGLILDPLYSSLPLQRAMGEMAWGSSNEFLLVAIPLFILLGEILLLLRSIPAKNAKAHRGEWDKSANNSVEARGKKLGIIGYGHIGTQLSIIAENIGMKVFYYDIENKLSLGNATQIPSLDELLSSVDVVSLHVPETASTQNMIGAEQLAKMKEGAILINAARGTVVDIEALTAALESGHLSGAAIDVFPTEPKANGEPFVSPLQKFDNVLLTPHIGGSTQEAQENIGLEVSSKLVKYSDNGSTLTAVNFPEVSLPEDRKSVV